MGFAPIFLIGADLGYPGLAIRFSKYTRVRRVSLKYKVKPKPEMVKRLKELQGRIKIKPHTPEEQAEMMMLNEIMDRKIGIEFGWKWKRTEGGMASKKTWGSSKIVISENDIIMDHIQGIYRKQLMRVVALDTPQVINASEGTILDDMMLKVPPMYPIDFQDVGTDPFKHLIIPKEEIRHKAELFLARRRMYLLPASVGNACIAMDDWKKELQGAIEIINQGSDEYKIDYDIAWKHLEEITNGITYVTD